MPFSYQSQKLSQARRALMLPHSRGEAESIAEAFGYISIGFHLMASDGLDDDARRWVNKLKDLMDTSGLQDASGRGLFVIKAEQFTDDDKIEMSRIVDELAHWFERKCQQSLSA